MFHMWIIWNLGYAYIASCWFLMNTDFRHYKAEREVGLHYTDICAVLHIYIYISKLPQMQEHFFQLFPLNLQHTPPRDAWNPWQVHRPLSGSVFFLPCESHTTIVYIYIHIYTSVGGFTKLDSWSHWVSGKESGFSGILPRFLRFF